MGVIETDRPGLPTAAERWVERHRAGGQIMLAVALTAILGVLTVSGAKGVDWDAGWIAVLVGAFGTLHATVALRLYAPALAFALASAAMLVVALVPDAHVTSTEPGGPDRVSALFLPSSLVFLLVLYNAAARLPVRLGRAALAVTLVGAVIAGIRMSGMLGQLAAGGWLVPVYTAVGLAVVGLATWGLGRLSAARRVRAVAEREGAKQRAVREERARIAREMHDIVAHSLSVIVRQAEGGAFVAGRRPDAAAEVLRTVAETGRGALSDMRGLLDVLRDPESAGQPAAPQPTLADLPELVDRVRGTGVEAELSATGERFPVGAATELAAYRLAQEGMTNTMKHAGRGARVTVTLAWRADDLAVDVTDDGGEPDSNTPVASAGVGLTGLRDRVRAVGGTFDAMALERGFRVRACFPRRGNQVRA
jgi:signal transduction histidine kinase